MPFITKEFTFSYSIHDSWTETLAGSCYLISKLSEPDNAGDKSHLCRLVLISANHLIEKHFFDLTLEVLDGSLGSFSSIRKKYDEASLYSALRNWPQLLSPSKSSLDFESEPLLSADLLRLQRNNSIHKNSESVSLEMAKKSLFTAVETCRYLWGIFKPDLPFKYEGFLNKYPVENAGHYSTARNVNL